jgi:hypothetical protein
VISSAHETPYEKRRSERPSPLRREQRQCVRQSGTQDSGRAFAEGGNRERDRAADEAEEADTGEGRRTWFETIDEMQKVLDEYLAAYNTKRPHQGRGMNGRTPIAVFMAGLPKPTPKQKEKSPPQKTDDQLAA